MLLTILTKSSIFDNWLGSEYAFLQHQKHRKMEIDFLEMCVNWGLQQWNRFLHNIE